MREKRKYQKAVLPAVPTAIRQPDFATHAKHDMPKTAQENATAVPATAPAAGWNTAIR